MSKKVLVAEDEYDLRELYITWLEQEDYQVVAAENGLEAYELWTEDVDVAILDRRMPEIYGDKTLEKIRDDGFETPVAMITAVEADLDISGMGFDSYLDKPITKDDFISTIEDLLPTVEVRNSVRDFVRTGLKMHKLQQKHPIDLLDSHEQYQDLRLTHQELRNDIKHMSDYLNEYEREQMKNHITFLCDPDTDLDEASDSKLVDIATSCVS